MFAEAFQYKQWSDERTLAAIRLIDAERQPQAIAFARQQLNHMLLVEEMFRARLLGEVVPHGVTNTASLPGLDELALRLDASNRWLLAYDQALSEADAGQWLDFRFADGQAGRMTRREMLFHLVNHGTYHRGAIGHALDLAGAPRPADTYTVFIHAAQPQRRGAASV